MLGSITITYLLQTRGTMLLLNLGKLRSCHQETGGARAGKDIGKILIIRQNPGKDIGKILIIRQNPYRYKVMI